MNKQTLDMVLAMARFGLAEIVKDSRNTTTTVAECAAALEQWRMAVEKAHADAPQAEGHGEAGSSTK